MKEIFKGDHKVGGGGGGGGGGETFVKTNKRPRRAA